MSEEIIDIRSQPEIVDSDGLISEINTVEGVKIPNCNVRFMSEARQLEVRWNKTELLNGIKDRYRRMAIAVMLENQRLMNEVATAKNDTIYKKFVPLARDVFTEMKAWDWVSIQPLLGPTGLVFYFRKREDSAAVESEDVSARTRFLKRRIAEDFGVVDSACDFAAEIDAEILTDLFNNCRYAKEFDLNVKTEDQLRQEVVLLQDEMCVAGYEPTFIVVNSGLRRLLPRVFYKLSDKLKLYDNSAVSGVLLGRKGESYMESGYVYSPYVPFTTTPLDLESKKFGVLTRYGKKLCRDGSKHYGKINVKLTKELEEKL